MIESSVSQSWAQMRAINSVIRAQDFLALLFSLMYIRTVVIMDAVQLYIL